MFVRYGVLALTLLLTAAPAFAGFLEAEVTATKPGVAPPLFSDSAVSPPGFVDADLDLTGLGLGADTGIGSPPFTGDDPGFLHAHADDGGTPDMATHSGITMDAWMYDATPDWILTASAFTELSITNTRSTAAHYWFDFSISPILLGIADYAPGPTPVEVTYSADISVDGTSEYASSATLSGDPALGVGLFPHTPIPPGGPIPVFDPIHQHAVLLGPAGGVIDLGFLAPGETITLTTLLTGEILTDGIELGGYLDIEMGGRVRVDPPVPEPASAALLGLGVFGAWVRRKMA